MQAGSRAACETWVDAIRKAKSEFDTLGPWQMRGLAAQITDRSVTKCTIVGSLQKDQAALFSVGRFEVRNGTSYTVFTLEARTQGGACPINRPCAQQYVGKSQSCMVISGRLIAPAPAAEPWRGTSDQDDLQGISDLRAADIFGACIDNPTCAHSFCM